MGSLANQDAVMICGIRNVLNFAEIVSRTRVNARRITRLFNGLSAPPLSLGGEMLFPKH